ncbi:MAG TPA: GNAT family protein [Gemmatimonadaceae bacterium]|nr:GNAT family protein [Gemmatimonadaceae bacterium]
MKPVTLDGDRVRMEPMTEEHLDALVLAGGFDELWLLTAVNAAKREDMKAYMDAALADAAKGTALPFVTIDKESGRVIGSSRFGNIDPPNRKVEIGWTWITPAFQRTHVNSEAKLLMMTHAFEVWNCVRVELKTDVLNMKSRNAMLRIGAIEEGVLRRNQLTQRGRYRDSIYFSVLDTEWPAVKERLQGFIARRPDESNDP